MDYSKVVPVKRQAEEKTTSAKPEILGLDYLSTLKRAEEVEFTVPFNVKLTFDVKRHEGKVVDVKNIRFYTSDLEDASFEVAPYFNEGEVVRGKPGEEGTLVVRCAKQKSMFDVCVDERGHQKISFLARPKFVSFNGRKAEKFTSVSTKFDLFELCSKLHPSEKTEDESK